MEDFNRLLKKSKRRLLAMHFESNSGHLGGNLSCIDALLVLQHLVMKPEDQFLLSKGHSAGALYVSLWSLNKLTDLDLKSFAKDDTHLPGHPSGNGIPELLFSTGSLGHGPSLAAGLALAARHKQTDKRVYCLCSDGEWQEGSCWEALTFAVHNRLDNLTIIIDQNGLQGFGKTEEVISCSDLTAKISSFGAHVLRVDGHDCMEIKAALEVTAQGLPSVVILDTIKGKGTHFENTVDSHYLPLTEEQYREACLRLDGSNEL
jgi:transketolase